MRPGVTSDTISWMSPDSAPDIYHGPPRNISYIDNIRFDSFLQPTSYNIEGTHPDSAILLLDVMILDCAGNEPYRGDVLIRGERFVSVGVVQGKDALLKDPQARVFHGQGRTLVPGLGDAHSHLTWNGSDLNRLGRLDIEEHTLLTAPSAACYLDSGYTMCFGAASAKDRLDVVVRDAINAGDIPGPRYLANGKELARRNGELVAGITAFADGPDEMRSVIKHHIALGVDQVKLSMSGEEMTEVRSARDCYFTDEETIACVDEAHKHGKRVCSHARARDSIKMCVRPIKPGHLADCILVDGSPLEKIEVLQDHSKLDLIIINGRVHKAGLKEYIFAREQPIPWTLLCHADFPEVKRQMQKNY